LQEVDYEHEELQRQKSRLTEAWEKKMIRKGGVKRGEAGRDSKGSLRTGREGTTGKKRSIPSLGERATF